MEEKRPKVLALYQAVLSLLDEGADINAMKVSDITERAGIGKGTAYDYFKSKEEIIASALTYDMDLKIRAELVRMEECGSFAQKIRYVFDWVAHQHAEQKSFTRFLRLTTQSCEVSNALHEELLKRQNEGCMPIQIVMELCREGKENGELRQDIPEIAAGIRVLAEMAAFAMYLERREELPEVEPGWMKDFLCEGLIQSLSEK